MTSFRQKIAIRVLDFFFWSILGFFLVGGVSWDGTRYLTFPQDLLRIGAIAYAVARISGLCRMRDTTIYRWIDTSWNEVFSGSDKKWSPPTWVFVFTLTWAAACFVAMPLLRHWNFGSWHWDLGVIENAIYNGSRDLSFRTFLLLDERDGSLIPYFPRNRLDLSVFLFAGIFRFFPHSEVLLVLQSLALLSGIIPATLLAKKVFPKNFPVWFAPLFYFSFDTIHRLNLWDIHGQAYMIPLGLWAIYFIDSKRLNLALVFMFLSAIWREDAWLLFCGLAIYYGFRTRRYAFASLLFFLGLPMLPLFSAGFQRVTPLDERYSYLGPNFSEAVVRLKQTPWLPFRFLVENPSNREFLAQLFYRGAFGAFLFAGWGPLFALLVPLSEVAFASHPGMHNWLNHYVGAFAAPLIAGVFLGWGRLGEIAERFPRFGVAVLSGSAAIALSQLSYLEPTHVRQAITDYPKFACMRSIVADVPADARVITNDPFISQLDMRTHIGKIRREFNQDWANLIITADRSELDAKGPWKSVREKCGFWIATR